MYTRNISSVNGLKGWPGRMNKQSKFINRYKQQCCV